VKRKTIFLLIASFCIALIFVAYVFWPKPSIEKIESLDFNNCLVFQSDSVEKPCYIDRLSPGQTNIPTTEQNIIIIPSNEAASSTVMVPSECTDSASVFERDDCVIKKAITSKNTGLCTLVSGSLAQSVCLRDVGGSVTLTIPIQNQSYDAFLRSTSSVLPSTIQNTVVSSPNTYSPLPSAQTDTRFSADALTQRFRESPLSLFGVSPYQVKPGDTISLQGTGFSDTNDVHVGGYTITVVSDDGFSLSFPAPSSLGEYDVWITNKNGSSQVIGRPIKIVVTTNPVPLPTVLSVLPNPAEYGDTIIITGNNFSNTNTISTSFGIMENVASSGGTISIRLSDMSFASQIKDIPYMKGRKTPILLYIKSDGGVSKEAYTFDVQF